MSDVVSRTKVGKAGKVGRVDQPDQPDRVGGDGPDGSVEPVRQDGPAGRPGWSSLVGLRATLHREYRILTHNRTNLLLAIVPTAVYLLLFATSLTHLVGTVRYGSTQVSYQDFSIPAIMLSSMIAASTTSGTALFQEELGGMGLELWSYPLGRAGYIAGKLLATTTLVLVQSLAALGVGVAVFDVGWGAGGWLAILVGTVLASLAFNGLYLFLATLIHDFQRFMVLINVVGPVMLFGSPSFYPIDRMPLPLRWFSVVNPVTYGIRAIRDSALFGLTRSWPAMVVLVAVATATCVATARTLVLRARQM